MAYRRERIDLDQIGDRNRPHVLDVGAGAADRILVERDRDEAFGVGWRTAGHRRLRRIATERA